MCGPVPWEGLSRAPSDIKMCCPCCGAMGPVKFLWNCRELDLFNLHLQFTFWRHKNQTCLGITVGVSWLGNWGMDYYIMHPGGKESNYNQTLALGKTKCGLGYIMFCFVFLLDKVERMVFSKASYLLASYK